MQQLQNSRQRIYLGSILRSTLGFAHLNKQRRLQNVVNTLSAKFFKHKGHIKGLYVILKIQDTVLYCYRTLSSIDEQRYTILY